MAVLIRHRWPARLLAALIAAGHWRGGDTTGTTCTLVKPSKSTESATYNCSLAQSTASPLAGTGYTWHVTGQLTAPLAILAGGTLVGQNDPTGAPTAKVGPIEVLGSDVTIRNVGIIGGITITKNAARVTVKNVVVHPDAKNKCVGVTAFSHAHKPETISIDGLTIAGSTLDHGCTRKKAMAALAHVSGTATVSCGKPEKVIIQQPSDSTRSILTPGCTRVDLGAMLSVYGVRYETQFNHFDYIPHASGWSHWVATLAVLNAILAIMLVMCGWTRWRESERAERAKKTE